MENNTRATASGADRKLIERNRRNQMKALYSKLNSLIPHQNSREPTSLPDQLDEATNYIKKLQTNLERMKERKESLVGMVRRNCSRSVGVKYPEIKIQEVDSALEVVLITGLDGQFIFNETIRILHEEGADIVNASFSVMDDTVFHTIHSKVGDSAPGFGAVRISERLNKFLNDILNLIK